MTELNSPNLYTKALVYHGPHQMKWEDWPIGQPGSGEALINVRAVGICGSDIHGYTGESGRRTPPMVMGHEVAGDVIAVGPEVDPGLIGQAVIIQPFIACGVCVYCSSGRVNLCRNRKFYGASVSGAMAEQMVVPVENLLPCPAGLEYSSGTMAEPLSVAIHAVRRAGDLSGSTVLVAGSGPIGLFTMKAARQAGAHKIVVTDLAPERLQVALAMGADAALDPRLPDFKQKFEDAIGSIEVDVAFDAVGIQPTFDQAVKTVKPGGSVVALGGWQTIALNLGPLVAREVEIRGTFNFTPDEFRQAIHWLSEKIVDPTKIPIQTYPMPTGAAVFEQYSRQLGTAIKIVLVL